MSKKKRKQLKTSTKVKGLQKISLAKFAEQMLEGQRAKRRHEEEDKVQKLLDDEVLMKDDNYKDRKEIAKDYLQWSVGRLDSTLKRLKMYEEIKEKIKKQTEKEIEKQTKKNWEPK